MQCSKHTKKPKAHAKWGFVWAMQMGRPEPRAGSPSQRVPPTRRSIHARQSPRTKAITTQGQSHRSPWRPGSQRQEGQQSPTAERRLGLPPALAPWGSQTSSCLERGGHGYLTPPPWPPSWTGSLTGPKLPAALGGKGRGVHLGQGAKLPATGASSSPHRVIFPAQCRTHIWVSCVAGRFFIIEPPEKPDVYNEGILKKKKKKKSQGSLIKIYLINNVTKIFLHSPLL